MDEPIETWTVAIDADTRALRSELDQMTKLGNQFGRTLTRSFQSIVVGGRSVTDVVRNLGQQLSTLALRAAFRPLEQGIGNLFSNVFSGISGRQTPGMGSGAPLPFNRGGVVAAPTYFPMAGGRTGLMGERGAEAIMPLARASDGSLGVRADGMSRGISVTLNVTTSDAESFARSESQISSLLARAVSQGQRNL